MNEPLISFLIPAKDAENIIHHSATQVLQFFRKNFPEQFEIIIIPNSASDPRQKNTLEVSQQLALQYPEIRVCPHHFPLGKGAALKTGFLNSRGRWIFFTDADLPFDLSYFKDAAALLSNNTDLIIGNRRLDQSWAKVSANIIPFASKRHIAGISFNYFTRLLFGISTKDTQAGIKAMSRRLAQKAFEKQKCPGFFFDLELILTARGHQYDIKELPVTFNLKNSITTVKLFRDTLLAFFWLTKILYFHASGNYQHQRSRTPN